MQIFQLKQNLQSKIRMLHKNNIYFLSQCILNKTYSDDQIHLRILNNLHNDLFNFYELSKYCISHKINSFFLFLIYIIQECNIHYQLFFSHLSFSYFFSFSNEDFFELLQYHNQLYYDLTNFNCFRSQYQNSKLILYLINNFAIINFNRKYFQV